MDNEKVEVAATREIAILSGLAKSLSRASEVLRQGLSPKFYIVVVRDVGEPGVYEFETLDDCLAKLQELQIEQINNPDNPIYVNMFEGRRWKLTKQPAPGISSGDSFVPLKPIKSQGSENGSIKSLLDILQFPVKGN